MSRSVLTEMMVAMYGVVTSRYARTMAAACSATILEYYNIKHKHKDVVLSKQHENKHKR